MDFVAMDFETANRTRASACSLALVVVRASRIVDSFYTLIDPEEAFEPQNIRVHGITSRAVQGQPSFPQVWPHIAPLFAESGLVAAHNAPFDVSVLRQELVRYDLPPVHYQVLDTARTARKLMPDLHDHKLETVSAALAVPLYDHHNALADSYACARILLAQAAAFGQDTLSAMLKQA
ncbi:3'-5' exonuclease [Lacticaseibacillus yichunensis]|uniref:3'-5' exonuclease n=1 Tax=Lacticaseibacillus yichunensis TaxID=2486015 RepID=A0ABW4CPL9_9LACO|nr:3'-5' exonuclease [Lacticaseibacillus yichunensis]